MRTTADCTEVMPPPLGAEAADVDSLRTRAASSGSFSSTATSLVMSTLDFWASWFTSTAMAGTSGGLYDGEANCALSSATMSLTPSSSPAPSARLGFQHEL